MCTSRKKRSNGSRSYLGIVWPDYLCLAIVAIVELSLHEASIYHYKARLIPIWPSVILSDNGVTSYIRAETRISYPLEPEPIPSFECGLIVVFVPLLVIALFQIKFRSIWDFHAGAVGVLKALVST
jgi:diacylglycerol diphosphate phosphatase/phosphatidate phosphatase